MNDFETALVSPGKNSLIPEEDNWFGPLVGTWDIEWVDGHGTEHERHVKGEWDFFMGSGRHGRPGCVHLPFPGGPEDQNLAGRRLRHDDQNSTIPSNGHGTFYGVAGESTRLEARKEGARIVLTEITGQKMKWIFSELTENTFHWRNMATEDGMHWFLQGEAFAARRI